MLVKEYRVPMPLTTEEYKIGQLYMIAKHCLEQSGDGEGVEVIENRPHHDDTHGNGQYTEKRIHLSNKLPSWIQALIPRIFYITEKAWNYYPYTLTEYTCSFVPRFHIQIETRYEDNCGDNDELLAKAHRDQLVEIIDIAYDDLSPKHYKEEEDLTKWKSVKRNRGPLQPDWIRTTKPIMCSYKSVRASFEVWGLQSRVEEFTHKCIRDVLMLGHRQATAWLDQWVDMTQDDVRRFETQMHKETNQKVLNVEPKKSWLQWS
uniref:EOG090X00NX n=1 Tax=Lynceus sp. MCZ IZ 141354 TaxID=1930659 RepID=A0A9N6WQU9_9CRUS|nr:EOG090X00NX [Lynceus sp. MCZ IZ 141354]